MSPGSVRRTLQGTLVAGLSSVVLLGCGDRASAPSTQHSASQAQVHQTTVETPGFDPASAIDTNRSAIQELLRTDSVEDALNLARSTLAQPPAPRLAGEIRWIAGKRAAREGRWTDARQLLAPLAASEHPLAWWASLTLAGGLLEHAPAEAVDIAAQVAHLDWPGRGRARRLEAHALRNAGRATEALNRYQALLSDLGDDTADASVLIPVAELTLETHTERGVGSRKAREAALNLYRRLLVRTRSEDVVDDVDARIAETLRRLPPRRRRALRHLSPEEQLAQGRTLYRDGAWQKTVEHLEELADETEAADSIRCEAQFLRAQALLRLRRRDQGAQEMEAVASGACSRELRTRAAFNAARAHARRGRAEKARTQYQQVETLSPASTLADDARYRGALASLELGDETGFQSALSTLPTNYPDGDMRGEARFRLAWHARQQASDASDARTRREHWTDALRWLDASIADDPQESAEDIRGRSHYWRARTQAELGRQADAIAEYLSLSGRFPLSYYGQQALARLRETASEQYEAEIERLRGGGPATTPLTFPTHPAIESGAMQRGLSLLRVDEPALARREFDDVMTRHRSDPEVRLIVAAAFAASGDFATASRLTRSRLASFAGEPPHGRAWHLWRIAYPQAFAPLIEGIASRESVPAAFVRAVAREESAFDPEAVSVANAYGLIQLIRPTARRFARELGLESSPQALKQPETNLRIGTRFIGFLWRHYALNPAVVPAAYNAGEGASDRWLRARGDETLDVWIENIPYDETRRYTRRVLQSYGIYRWLDDRQLPPLRPQLPRPEPQRSP